MKKWQYAAIAAIVIVCVLTAAFFFGDSQQPETGEKTLSTQSTTTLPSTTEEPPTTSAMPAPTEPTTTAVTEPTVLQSEAADPPETDPPATESQEKTPTQPTPTQPSTTMATEPTTTEPPPTTTEPPVPQCTISISCTTVLSHMDDLKAGKESIVPENGWMLGTVSVELQEGDTVFDVLQRVTRQYGIALEFSMSPIYNTAYIEGIGNLYERDCGTGSGWLYSVNGSFPSVGCSDYTLSDGDSIAWCYTCEMGADLS